MRNLKLTLSYDGTRYQGFSKPQSKEKKTKQDGIEPPITEKNAPQNTVSAKLTETLSRLAKEPVELFCGAKTDPGVHVLAQTVNFHTSCPLSTSELCRSLNHYLPQDVCVHSISEVPERFHASLNARAEVYECRILNAPMMDPFLRKYTLHVTRPLDVAAMETAAEILLGKHDFLPFSFGKAKKKKSTERELTSIKITAMPNTDFPCEIRVCLTANRFLYQMPRLIVGTLIDIGLRTRAPGCVEHILACQENPGAPCDPHGLYLKEILYDK